MALLEIENLRVSYGQVEVLHGISLHVDEGEIVTLLGANGAGKSTTLLSVSRLVNPTEGRIVFDGIDLLKHPSHEIVGFGVAQAPEGRRVFGTMTVEENLMLGAFLVRDEAGKIKTLLDVCRTSGMGRSYTDKGCISHCHYGYNSSY